MIPVSLSSEPAEFHREVRVPGLRSVYEMTGQEVPEDYSRQEGRPFAQRTRPVRDVAGALTQVPVTRPEDLPPDEFPSYWTVAIPWLMECYNKVCMYCCFRIHSTASPSVDHLVPKSFDWNKVYEWSNYRLAALMLNARKNNLLMILDPFDVQPGWFAIEFTFGLVIPGPATEADPGLWAWIEATIAALGLQDYATDRMRDYEAYVSGDVSLRRLREESPFVAQEIVRQGKLRPGDT